MKVAFMVGPKGDKIALSINNIADNVEFFIYDTIENMIRESTVRHVFFDRVVFSEKVLGDPNNDLNILNSYLKEYSDKTSVVFICSQESYPSIEIFNKVFNSPLYTPAILPNVKVSMLIDIVTLDIISVKTKYYTSDVDVVKTFANKVVEEPKPEISSVNAKPAKRGLFSRLFGGNKNNSENSSNQFSGEEPSSDERKGANSGMSDELDNSARKDVSSGRKRSNSESGSGSLKNDLDENRLNLNSSLSEVHGDNLGDEFSQESSNDDLFLGDFGAQHIDTDYLDEDLEEEIIKSIESAKTEDNKGSDNDYYDTDYDDVEEGVVEEGDSSVINIGNLPRVSIISSARGVGSTTFIVDKAISLVEEGFKVILIDLDYSHNGILSFVDTDGFYKNDADRGISMLRAYEEDGVTIVSNGYGRSISASSLDNLVDEVLNTDSYDYIIFDCPIDCIDCLTSKLVSSCDKIYIVSNGNRGSLLSVIHGVTCSSLETSIFFKSEFIVVNKIPEYRDDIEFLRNTLLFGKEDWLSKVE